MTNNNNQYIASNITEAILDIESLEPDTKVNIPHEQAIEDAKDWVDENEK